MLLTKELDVLIPALNFSSDCQESRAHTAEISSALQDMLSSKIFSKSPRMSRLMRFLAEMVLLGRQQELNEQLIGIAVFDREQDHYFPGEDPVVRVQVGRLREKLKRYYANDGARSAWRFFIPVGCYIPEIRRAERAGNEQFYRYLLALAPLKCITSEGRDFGLGLTEELSHALFQRFGQHVVSHAFAAANEEHFRQAPGHAAISHLLRGSIRVEASRARVNLQLIDAQLGCIAWSELFEREITPGMRAQAELASEVGNSLQRYFSAA